MPGWKGRVTSRQALWKLWAAEKSLPRHHGNPDKWRERKRAAEGEFTRLYILTSCKCRHTPVFCAFGECRNLFSHSCMSCLPHSFNYFQFTHQLSNFILPIRLSTHPFSETWPFAHISKRHVSPPPCSHSGCLHNNHVLDHTLKVVFNRVWMQKMWLTQC